MLHITSFLIAQTSYISKPIEYSKTRSSTSSYIKRLEQLGLLKSNTNNTYSKKTSCDDFIKTLRDNISSNTYTSYDSSSIALVEFYSTIIDNQYHYYAIVCFYTKNGGCTDFIYQVSSNTEYYYSSNYKISAGKAFWKYIQPYKNNLSCSAQFN